MNYSNENVFSQYQLRILLYRLLILMNHKQGELSEEFEFYAEWNIRMYISFTSDHLVSSIMIMTL